jgi:hypothetical protein
VVFDKPANSKLEQISVSRLIPGIYFIKIELEDKLLIEKIIIDNR